MAKATANAYAVDKSFHVWQGVFSILLGVIVLVWPGMTALTLTLFLSIWLLIAGVVNIVMGVTSVKKGGYGWLVSLGVGILQLGVGAYLVQRPGVTALTIITLLALVFLVQGVAYFLHTFLAGELKSGERVLSMVFAVLSVIAAVWLWRYPVQSGLAFVWLIGLYAIVSGAIQIAAGADSDA